MSTTGLAPSKNPAGAACFSSLGTGGRWGFCGGGTHQARRSCAPVVSRGPAVARFSCHSSTACRSSSPARQAAAAKCVWPAPGSPDALPSNPEAAPQHSRQLPSNMSAARLGWSACVLACAMPALPGRPTAYADPPQSPPPHHHPPFSRNTAFQCATFSDTDWSCSASWLIMRILKVVLGSPAAWHGAACAAGWGSLEGVQGQLMRDCQDPTGPCCRAATGIPPRVKGHMCERCQCPQRAAQSMLRRRGGAGAHIRSRRRRRGGRRGGATCCGWTRCPPGSRRSTPTPPRTSSPAGP